MDSARLSVQGVCKGYSRGGQWTAVLENVTFEVEPGEIVAVTGARLEGKTTLLRIAAGIERPDRGSVSLGDRSLTEERGGKQSDPLGRRIMRIIRCGPKQGNPLGHQIMWIDRRGPKLRMEVGKFVGLPLAIHGRGRGRAERAAAQMLNHVEARSCLGRLWGDLSNWQQLLVSLARAFAGKPQLVIIDDLLDALGGPATEEASDLLRSLVEASEPHCGVLMSTSDLESAIYADRVWSITSKRSLKLMAGHQGDGKVVPFPDRDRARAGGSQHVGSS